MMTSLSEKAWTYLYISRKKNLPINASMPLTLIRLNLSSKSSAGRPNFTASSPSNQEHRSALELFHSMAGVAHWARVH